MSIRVPPVCSLLALLAACASPDGPGAEEAVGTAVVRVQPTAGRALVVSSSLRIPPGEYLLPPIVSAQGEPARGVLHVEGQRGVVLDLSGVSLRGMAPGTDLDQHAGVGILVRGSSDVTIRGGLIGGYKVCIQVEDSEHVTVEDAQFDGWFGQRLYSTPFAEDGRDWLWPHANDGGEWNANYGAAISFTDCRGVVVRRSRGRHGQNGILLTRTSDSEIYDNDFSFLSGWGLGMYRSSENVVSHNVFDYCIRGFSHGVYSRGQDSAGILMFERCCDNVFAYNSATHGGDGVFLFGGLDTVEGKAYERGETEPGTSDRNLWYQNDLRFAAANSLEATFSSRNVAIGNDLSGSNQHGVWGGYSRDMVILGNKIDDTVDGGITIEHGQRCLIAQNSLRNNHVGVELYWDDDEALVDGPFGQHHDTSSSGHWILDNTFAENDQDVMIRDTTGVAMRNNAFGGPNELLDVTAGIAAVDVPKLEPDVVKGWLAGRDGKLPSGRVVRSTFHKPNVPLPAELENYRSFQPPVVPGSQRVSALERGELGGLQTIVMGPFGPWDFRSGEARPPMIRPGGLLANARWDARWFRWSVPDSDPRADLARWRELALQPLVSQSVDTFVDPFASDAQIRERLFDVPFGLIARASIGLERGGRYELTVVSDDGVRVSIDGGVVLEDWTWHPAETQRVEVALERGLHEFVLEYFQIDGAVALSIELERIGD